MFLSSFLPLFHPSSTSFVSLFLLSLVHFIHSLFISSLVIYLLIHFPIQEDKITHSSRAFKSISGSLSLHLTSVICSDDDLIRSGDEEEDDDLFPSDEADDSESDDGMSFFEEEETKSRFTNYSMTSSVLRRNEGWETQSQIANRGLN